MKEIRNSGKHGIDHACINGCHNASQHDRGKDKPFFDSAIMLQFCFHSLNFSLCALLVLHINQFGYLNSPTKPSPLHDEALMMNTGLSEKGIFLYE